MPAKKKTPPPLYGLRADFVDALQATTDAATMLLLAVKTAIQLEQVKPAVRGNLTDAADRLSIALSGQGLFADQPGDPE